MVVSAWRMDGVVTSTWCHMLGKRSKHLFSIIATIVITCMYQIINFSTHLIKFPDIYMYHNLQKGVLWILLNKILFITWLIIIRCYVIIFVTGVKIIYNRYWKKMEKYRMHVCQIYGMAVDTVTSQSPLSKESFRLAHSVFIRWSFDFYRVS